MGISGAVRTDVFARLVGEFLDRADDRRADLHVGRSLGGDVDIGVDGEGTAATGTRKARLHWKQADGLYLGPRTSHRVGQRGRCRTGVVAAPTVAQQRARIPVQALSAAMTTRKAVISRRCGPFRSLAKRITVGCGGGPAAATDNNACAAGCGVDTTPTVAVSRQNPRFRAGFVRRRQASNSSVRGRTSRQRRLVIWLRARQCARRAEHEIR